MCQLMFGRIQWTAILLGLLCPAVLAQGGDADALPRGRFYPPHNATIVFLGDSITHAGGYVDFIDTYLATRFPEEQFRLLNRGMPSETVAGTSEPVHTPPRPNLAARFEKTIGPLNPDVVVACYGMNDGIYRSFDKEIFSQYQLGIERLIDRVRIGTRAKLVLVTPPPFDFAPHRGRPRQSAEPSYLSPAEDYDQTLDRFSEWLMTRCAPQAQPSDKPVTPVPLVIDVHSSIKKHLELRRQEDSSFRLASDGIHLETTGQLLMAAEILAAWGAPATVDELHVDVPQPQTLAGNVTELKPADSGASSGAGLEFTWTTRLPMPFDPKCDAKSVVVARINENLNVYTLRITGLKPGTYELWADGRRFATASASELANDIDLMRCPDFPTHAAAAEVLNLIRQRQTLLKQLWIKDDLHPRLAAARAEVAKRKIHPQQLEELSRRIHSLSQPRAVAIRVMPVRHSSNIAAKLEAAQEAGAEKVGTQAGGSKSLVGTSTLVVDPDWKRDASPEMGLMGHRANHSSRRNAGSAAMLTGATVFYEVFVSDRSSSWPEQRQQEIRARMDEALAFLARQGLKYQQRLHFAQVFAKPVMLDEEVSQDPQADAGWTERAVAKANGTDCAKLVEQFRKSHSADSVLIVLHLNKPGRSYNISFYRGVPQEFSSERLVLFTHFNDMQQTPSATYAHEVLHGFGAGDLYFPFDQNDRRYREAKFLFSNDVMFRIDDRIDNLVIDEWTAYRVGWLPRLRSELTFLEDPR